jgi:hypothetical protein
MSSARGQIKMARFGQQLNHQQNDGANPFDDGTDGHCRTAMPAKPGRMGMSAIGVTADKFGF